MRSAAIVLTALCVAAPAVAQPAPRSLGEGGPQRPAGGGQIQSIGDRTSGLKKVDGFFPLYWDERAGSRSSAHATA